MRSGSRAVAAWLTLAGIGFAAAFAFLSQHYAAPTPRWDLIGCFAVAALGIVGCLATVRRRTFDEFGGTGPRPWWPDLRALWKGIFPLAWFMILVYFVGALIHVSPAAERMVEAGHVIEQVRVDEVISTERKGRDRGSRHFRLDVRASIPYADGNTSKVAEFDSRQPVKPGDKVWALYAPAAPELGVFLEEDRAELEEKTGGPESGMSSLVLVLLFVLLLAALLYTSPGLPRAFRKALRDGRVRRLPVRVAAGTVTLAESPSAKDYNKTGPNDQPELKPAPCLLLAGATGADGERFEAVVDRGIDPAAAARALQDRQTRLPAALYWIASGDGAGAGVLASGDHYLRCRRVTADNREVGPRAGEPTTAVSEGEGRRKPREIRRYPEWSAEQHTSGFGWLLFTLVLMGVMALGIGTIATLVLAVLAFLSLLFACYGASAERGEALEQLLPDSLKEKPEPQ
ncbi:hypothetical protein [Streptomyces sp. Da 82-17]|uniref:hypothetical protein n=1 Tax=Streptomyces sp. Da 82-17 TaxID=3377116 RepID=UPI0038D48AEA